MSELSGSSLPRARRALGIDFGRRNDRSSAYVLDYSHPVLEILHSSELLGGSYTSHLNFFNQLRTRYQCDVIIADASGVGDALYEQIPGCIGIVITGEQKNGRASIAERNLKRLSVSHKSLFAPLFHVINTRSIKGPLDEETKQQLMSLGIKFTRTGQLRFEAIRGHDDRVFALALAVYGVTYYGAKACSSSGSEASAAASAAA